MRNGWLILRREYLERVRTRSFIASTLLLPVVLIVLLVLPGRLATLKSGATRRIAIVCGDADFARALQSQLEAARAETGSSYQVELIAAPNEQTRSDLQARIAAGRLDAYLWLDDQALASRKIAYVARETNDFLEVATLQAALQSALLRHELLSRGVSSTDADRLAKPVDLDAFSIKGGQEKHDGGLLQFISVIVIVTMLYMTLILYGVAVMRSVLEEKTSRVMEVVLSSATARELMAGKILGIGAVGLAQVAIWIVLGLATATPGLMIASSRFWGMNLGPIALLAFAAFFALGYLLYSALYAALGAMVNSEQEAQLWQFYVVLPQVVPVMMMAYVIRQPNSPLSVGMSLVPLFAPVLMYLRVVVQTPPLWQGALSIVLLLLTLRGTVVVCSRIYRVGILMYGKRATLPEILKWVRFA